MLKYFYYVLLLFFAASCITNKKTIYIQDKRVNYTDTVAVPTNFTEYKIHTKDLLSIKVIGLDQKTTVFFNSDLGTTGNNPMMMGTPQAAYLLAYIVDDSGYVYMPVIGSIYIRGLTIDQAQKKIEGLVNEHVEAVSVFVKLVNFKVSILGDIRSPGMFYMYNPRMNIFEVLALGGDVTEVANRKRVKLIRQQEGRAEIVYLNLLDPKIISSKYNYIKPNDILYIENYKVKPFRSNVNSFTFALGLITTVFAIYTYVKIVQLGQ